MMIAGAFAQTPAPAATAPAAAQAPAPTPPGAPRQIPSMPPPPPGATGYPFGAGSQPPPAIDLNSPGIEAVLPSEIDVSGVAASVNGKPLSYQALVTKFLAAGAPQFLDEMINEQLIRQEAKMEGVNVTTAEVNAKLLDAKKFLLPQYPGQSWAQFLALQGRSESYIRDNIYDGLLAVKLVEKTMPAPTLVGKVHLYHILKLTTAVQGTPNPATDEVAHQEISDIRALIESGKATFQDEAKKESQDSTASKGGDLGWIGKDASLDPAFAAAAFALKPGEISQPVKSRYGWHLIYEANDGAHATPAEVATYVAEQRASEDTRARAQLQSYLQNLRKSAKIVNYVLPTPKPTGFSVPRPAKRTFKSPIVKTAPKPKK
jgi:parvulin-like peptidyl-prolyl isomerase